MSTHHADLTEQLRLACKSSGARWATWIYITHNPAAGDALHAAQWQIGAQTGLSKARSKALEAFLNEPVRHRWVSGALASARPRWQETGESQNKLDCGRVYVYPCSGSCDDRQRLTLLAAGADGLSTQGEAMLRLVGMRPPAQDAGPANHHGEAAPPSSLAVEHLEALYETSLEITARLELKTLLQHIALRARELAAARGAEVGLLEVAVPGSHTGGVRLIISETPWEAMQGIFIPYMTGLAGRIAAQADALTIADYNAWDGRLLPERAAPFKAAAGVPLMIEQEVIGTLTVLDDRPEKIFSPEDLQILKMFGAQAAIAIHNARLYAELSSRIQAQQQAEKRLLRAAQLAAIGDISTQIANEINEPIRRTALLLEMALQQIPDDSSLPPAVRRDLKLAQQQAQRAREMTNRLVMAAHETRPVESPAETVSD